MIWNGTLTRMQMSGAAAWRSCHRRVPVVLNVTYSSQQPNDLEVSVCTYLCVSRPTSRWFANPETQSSRVGSSSFSTESSGTWTHMSSVKGAEIPEISQWTRDEARSNAWCARSEKKQRSCFPYPSRHRKLDPLRERKSTRVRKSRKEARKEYMGTSIQMMGITHERERGETTKRG